MLLRKEAFNMRPNFKLYLLLFVFIGFSLNAQTPDKRPWGKYTGPHSLGFFSLDHDISIKSFLTNFRLKPTGKDIYCFSDSRNGLYINVRISEHDSGSIEFLMLSSFPNCKHMHVTETTIDPSIWKTSEGIGIGSTKQEVLKTYHTPIYDHKLEGLMVRSTIVGLNDSDKGPFQIGDSCYLYSCLMKDEKQSCDDLNATRIIGELEALLRFDKDSSDGLILVALCETEEERQTAIRVVR